jgi:hypothetical protein
MELLDAYHGPLTLSQIDAAGVGPGWRCSHFLHGAAMESNHPTGGLLRPAGFEDGLAFELNPRRDAAI